ncbi:MAG: 3-hydroxyacyl-CoA dehydrogenase family protein [Bacteroidetes bacterium]|nr:3-hydroxyacyl-CoA dehydrogenase family protein [Bacteroidota bacterium]
MLSNQFPKKIAVLGSAGKMGSGITLLAALDLADRIADSAQTDLKLYALDVSEESLDGLKKYVAAQSRKLGEKRLEVLRTRYHENIQLSDEELIEKYVQDVLSNLVTTTSIEDLKNVELIFEAVNENMDLKTRLIKTISGNCEAPPFIFTNTSSIPIKELEESTGLSGRVLGFHFYNPPAIQKLVELITTDSTSNEIIEYANTLAKRMRKIIVPSNDIAGFIGNGHFMRDLLYAFKELKKLQGGLSFAEGVYLIDFVTKRLLVRPMGIFQLADYVGLDVCKNILSVMDSRIHGEVLSDDLIVELFGKGVVGGQNSDGSQKKGIFNYEKNKISEVFEISSGDYVPISKIEGQVLSRLGTLPTIIPEWKDTIRSEEKERILSEYFTEMANLDSFGARFTMDYLRKSKDIGENLVSSGVTNYSENVNNVLLLGFYHAYGAINNYC